MKLPPSGPLNEAELEFLDELLLKYGNDDSILNVSGLDGFLTAVVSGPETIVPSRWLPEIFAASDNPDAMPEWQSEAEFSRFMGLVMQHMNDIVDRLMHAPDQFEALFMQSNPGHTGEKTPVFIAEDWCFGYMQGVALGNWPELPKEIDTWLEAIRLHGTEENFEVLGNLTLEEHQQTVAEIEPAACKLHGYWLARRSPAGSPVSGYTQPIQAGPKVGRNDPCPCGSGRKFKQCCLH